MSTDDVQDGVPTPNRIRIFDTTLRDGEQSPGASLTSAEKLEIARHLAALGVDIIEAGFPAASPDDLAAVKRIAEEVGVGDGPVIAGLARAVPSDVEKAWEAVQFAARPRIHTFISTSDIHLKYQMNMTREQVIERTREIVRLARSLCRDIEFSPMDAGRSEVAYVAQVCAVAIEEGATTLNIPDTVGYMTPAEYGTMIAYLIENTPGGKNSEIIWSVHCHDDLGMATANTLAGLQAGARQAEVTINGIGERAGNTSLEEVVMALHTRQEFFNLTTGINTTHLARTSRLVSNYTGIVVQPNKAIVGANAFAHEAGIHQDGQLKHYSTYEIMRPETVGVSESRLVLGKHSGRHAVRARLQELGYVLPDEQLKEVFARFKELADKKKNITDADLEALLADQLQSPAEPYKLLGIQVTCGQIGMPTATIKLQGPDGQMYIDAGIGTGPVDATYSTIDKIVKAPNTLLEFVIHAITEGIDALGEVTVRICTKDGEYRTFGGYGADQDVIVASAKAYIAALNRMIVATGGIGVVAEGDASAVHLSGAD
ncbi:MAG TPA: 2-isopropylmalate synthase [Aggregatilineales bacterium]|nr:2-isopropylmalate synthase [Aggregatilineales bacterium]